MKNIVYIIVLIFLANNSYSQTRNTLWLRGIGPASSSWLQTNNILKTEGYDFANLQTVGNGGNYDPHLGVSGAADLLDASITQENVLGIAHDYGGIILRDLQLQNNNISAMILDGVPNQGSSIIEYAAYVGNNSETAAQQMLNDVIDFREESDCDEDCGYIDNFKKFLNDLKSNGNNLLDVAPWGAALNNLTEPTVPFVIIYGTIEENSIIELINSQADQLGSGDDFYKTCYLDNLQEAQEETKDAFIKITITNTIGFASGLINGVTAVIDSLAAGQNPLTALVSAVTSFFNSNKERITKQIEELAKRDAELARLLKCELSHQLLQAQWEIQLMQNSNLTYVDSVLVSAGWDGPMCEEYCWNNTSGDVLEMIFCEAECALEHPDVSVETYALVLEDNDGILTKSEQLLEGDVMTYHLEKTDHLSEVSLFSGLADRRLADHLHEIFDGGVGAEFVIPK